MTSIVSILWKGVKISLNIADFQLNKFRTKGGGLKISKKFADAICVSPLEGSPDFGKDVALVMLMMMQRLLRGVVEVAGCEDFWS